ncbi:hypothetical protein [Pseudoprimorskyibacter insulae]|uniref:DUF4386 domain-containing protein n=1 Tax=Pseudoprimorskyibacter insulae TaxID=1695997 RepID=A0A2R8AZB4_9RHOB|nr:hypothetical protein [Pseudoprimorskyibacter insulae]SPF81184.1 hypothetical protein PRI8871_03006 [Pseudoprimorskyibacter insulae]
MTLTKAGGTAALICAGTYLIGFALLVSVLAPTGYGTTAINAQAVVDLIHASPSTMIAWNLTIYVVNALALMVLVVALKHRLHAAPGWAGVTQAQGVVWAALVLGAGMVANVAVEQALRLYATDPVAAAELWLSLHYVELGLGGGNEIAGGVWILCLSLAGLRADPAMIWRHWLGLAVGIGGLLTIFPPLGDAAGAVFGLGAIVWFIATGIALLRNA